MGFTGELHKSNAARKDAELQELRRVVAAKERSIDSLRTQLATVKGSLEAYTQESEAILQQRDGEVNIRLCCSMSKQGSYPAAENCLLLHASCMESMSIRIEA